MRKMVVNKNDRIVIYDSENKVYEKYVKPKLREKIQIFFGIKRSHGKNAEFLSNFLKKNDIKTYEVLSHTKYSYVTKEIEGKTLLDSILDVKENSKLIKEYLNKYIEIVKKIINLKLYYADFYFNNLMIDKNGEICIIDIDEMEYTLYSRIFKNKKVIPRLNQTLQMQFSRLKGYGVDVDIDANYVFEKIIEK
ncbi:hypothetical protein [Fusobacterium sp.]|uniref:hypothetical protein n=1 Tax=Fusobacterium sp. TaxID=68766 RepID=UPI0026188DA7|nr:hypothetical protein [Fusobacterium sp.]